NERLLVVAYVRAMNVPKHPQIRGLETHGQGSHWVQSLHALQDLRRRHLGVVEVKVPRPIMLEIGSFEKPRYFQVTFENAEVDVGHNELWAFGTAPDVLDLFVNPGLGQLRKPREELGSLLA